MKTLASVIASAWLVPVLLYSQKYYLWLKPCLHCIYFAGWYVVYHVRLICSSFFIKNHLPFYSSLICKQLYWDTGTVETDEYPWETAAVPAAVSFCFHMGLCQWQALHSLIFSVLCCSGGFLVAPYPPSTMARAEPAPHHSSCLRSPRNSCLLACFTGENQKTFPLSRKQSFLRVEIFMIHWNPSHITRGCLGKGKTKFTLVGPTHWSSKMFWLACKEIIRAFLQPSYDLQANLPASATAASFEQILHKEIQKPGSL